MAAPCLEENVCSIKRKFCSDVDVNEGDPSNKVYVSLDKNGVLTFKFESDVVVVNGSAQKSSNGEDSLTAVCSANSVVMTGTSDKKPVSARVTPKDGGFELRLTEDGKTEASTFRKVGGRQKVGGGQPDIGGGQPGVGDLNAEHKPAECPNYSGSYTLASNPTVKAVVTRDVKGSLSMSFDGSTPIIVDGTEQANGVKSRLTAFCVGSIIHIKGVDDDGKAATAKITPAGDGFDVELNGEKDSYRR